MNGINKIIGGFLGFLLAGPIGSLLGIVIGHIFDKNFSNQYDATIGYQTFGIPPVFFETTFLVMGYVAKLEGVISKAAIDNARKVMDNMTLSEPARLKAMHLFNQGKHSNFDVKMALNRLLSESYHNRILLRQFLIIQTQAAIENGRLATAKKAGLMEIYLSLGFQPTPLQGFEPLDAYERYQTNRAQHNHFYKKQNTQFNPYQVLGISKEASNKEIKEAYRRLLNQFHPDKLTSKGLSELEIKRAREKGLTIQKAYTTLRKQRGFV